MRRWRRALGYARVSSIEQTVGSSLEDQQRAIRAYAASVGVEAVTMYVEAESGIYAKIEKREQIQALLAEVRQGDIVLVDKLDRWSRDAEFSYRSIRELLAKGASFYSVAEQCDPSTSEGDTALGFRILFAREEHKRIRQRTVGTRKLLRERGYLAEGSVAWGYRRQDVKGAERNALVIVEEDAEAVRRVFSLCIAGTPLTAIAERVGQNRDRIFDVLHNRLYLGELRDGGTPPTWIRGKHAPIIDANTFQAAQDALASRLHKRGASGSSDVETATWWLRDVARCALCGARMSSAYAGPHGEGRRHYFRCFDKCTPRFVRVSVAESACNPLVLARLTELREQLAAPSESSQVMVASKAGVEAKIGRLQAKRARSLEAFTDGLMTREELRQAMSKIDAERSRLEAAIALPPKATDSQKRLALRSVEKISRMWARLDGVRRRTVVNELAKAVRIAADTDPVIDWRSADELAKVAKE